MKRRLSPVNTAALEPSGVGKKMVLIDVPVSFSKSVFPDSTSRSNSFDGWTLSRLPTKVFPSAENSGVQDGSAEVIHREPPYLLSRQIDFPLSASMTWR